MADVNDMSPQTGRFVNEDNEQVNLADLLGARIRSGTRYGTIDVATTATLLRLGATDLEDRHTLHIVNTGASAIYIGFDDLVTVANGLPIGAGEERALDLDPNDPIDIYGVAEAITTVRIVEVK